MVFGVLLFGHFLVLALSLLRRYRQIGGRGHHGQNLMLQIIGEAPNRRSGRCGEHDTADLSLSVSSIVFNVLDDGPMLLSSHGPHSVP